MQATPLPVPSGFKDATTDEATIRRWWTEEPTANVGMVCEPRSFALLDLDRHGDTDGLSVAQVLYGLGIAGPAPKTGGGLHVLYKHSGPEARNRTVAEGVELRVNGYVVAPPSVHPSGRRYQWLEEPTDEPLPKLPEWALNGQVTGQEGEPPPEQVALSRELAVALTQGVDQGRRNETAGGLAGRYLARGFSEAETLNQLVPWNRKHQPPLPEEELHKVVESVARTDARNHPDRDAEQLLTECTDTGNAEVLAALYGDRLRFDHRQKHWLVCGGHWWVEDTDGEPVRLAIESARWRHQQAFERLQGDKAKSVAVWAIRSKDRARVDAALSLAANLRPIADVGEGWDSDPWLLGVANRVLQLRTGVLREGHPEDRIMKHSQVAYEPDAECPRWGQFLEEVFSGDQELIGFVRRAIGYSLTGISREQCFFVLHGAGANGKSVLLEALRCVLGPYAFDAGFSTFEDPGRYPPHPEAMAELAPDAPAEGPLSAPRLAASLPASHASL